MGKYGFLDRFLHRAALQYIPIAELSFDLPLPDSLFSLRSLQR